AEPAHTRLRGGAASRPTGRAGQDPEGRHRDRDRSRDRAERAARVHVALEGRRPGDRRREQYRRDPAARRRADGEGARHPRVHRRRRADQQGRGGRRRGAHEEDGEPRGRPVLPRERRGRAPQHLRGGLRAREGARRQPRFRREYRRDAAVRRARRRPPRPRAHARRDRLSEDAVTLPPIGLARPELLALLLLAPLLGALVVLSANARARSLARFAGTAALSARSDARMRLRSALVLLAFVSLVIALAGPYVDLRARGARRLGVDVVLAVDVSQSMATRDVEPDRLRAARHFAEELGGRMIGSRVSLVLFAGQGTTRYPATTDPRILGEVLDNSGKGVRLQQGTSLAAAPTGVDPGRGRAIVVLSDGEVTLGGAADAGTLADRAITLYTIGIGTPKGGQIPTYDAATGNFTGYLRGPDGVAITSRLDESGLRRLASATGGRYWRYTGDDAVVGELAAQLRTLEAIEPIENAGAVPDERSQPFVAFAVAAVLVERLLSDRRRMPAPRHERLARPRRRRRVLGVAIGSTLLWSVACGDAASTIEDASGLFAAGNYQGALAKYRDLQAAQPDSPALAIDAGNALHMIGEHARALPEYAHAIDLAPVDVRAIAQYDRGNTLFRLGRLEDARDAYREALRLEPADRDAKFNLELVQRLLDGRRGTQQQPGRSGRPSASPGASGGAGASGASPSASPGTGDLQAAGLDEKPDP